MILENAPSPVPSIVCESAITGLAVDPQQTPLALIDTPPSEVIFPPETAVVEVIIVICAVVNVAGDGSMVVNDTWLP